MLALLGWLETGVSIVITHATVTWCDRPIVCFKSLVGVCDGMLLLLLSFGKAWLLLFSSLAGCVCFRA